MGRAERVWLDKDAHFVPGAVLASFERPFQLWVYSVSHSQLLLRSQMDNSRLDLLFKPVAAMKVRELYEPGLELRCATTDDHAKLLAAAGIEDTPWHRVLTIHANGVLDYVVCSAVGWQEDALGKAAPSTLAFFPSATDPTRVLPTTDIGSFVPIADVEL